MTSLMRVSHCATQVMLALGLCGCQDWHYRAGISRLAWANDDSGIALILVTFEEAKAIIAFGGDFDRRNERSQLLVDPVGSARSPVTPQLPIPDGQVRDVYWMRTKSYFILTYFADGGFNSERVASDGVRTKIIGPSTPCEGMNHDVVPSPSGAHLAVMVGLHCIELGNPDSILVRLLDAATLAEVGRDTIPASRFRTDSVQWTWRPAGDFVVAVTNHSTYSVAVGRPKQLATTPACFSPKTTSSAISSTGIPIYANGTEILKKPAVPSAAFGCQ